MTTKQPLPQVGPKWVPKWVPNGAHPGVSGGGSRVPLPSGTHHRDPVHKDHTTNPGPTGTHQTSPSHR